MPVGVPPTRWVGESGRDELRKRVLERDQLAEQLVVLGVADLGRILDVVEAVGALDLLDQPGMAGGGGFDVQRGRLLDERRIDGQLGRHRSENTGGTPTPARRGYR